ncbi:DUF6924 domain-containing protein [Streptomyces sp. NPDC015220]|uniref:DUF6924 domain-containing protein n=1 Tax=Streptomyces sp. NPDC015220 TaxID=3364947 RepID=UPI0036F87DD6
MTGRHRNDDGGSRCHVPTGSSSKAAPAAQDEGAGRPGRHGPRRRQTTTRTRVVGSREGLAAHRRRKRPGEPHRHPLRRRGPRSRQRLGRGRRDHAVLHEGSPERYASITVIDNPVHTGFTADQIQALIRRDDEDWPDSTLILIADDRTPASVEFPLPTVNNLPDDDDAPFRITLPAAGAFVVNMEPANTSFGDWGSGVDADGVCREEHC